MVRAESTSLLTDQYELTMVQAALHSGVADHRSVFEVFARRLAPGRRYAVASAAEMGALVGGGVGRPVMRMTACVL